MEGRRGFSRGGGAAQPARHTGEEDSGVGVFGVLNIRLLFLLLVLALARISEGTTYYVSDSSGDDHASGQSAATAWRTLARVNRAQLSPEDFVLLRRGDVWHDVLQPPSSGTVGHPITFGAYGQGARPVISGKLRTVSGVADRNKVNAVPAEVPEERFPKEAPAAVERFRDVNIDNHERSHIVYDGLDLREAREGLRLYAWSGEVKDITLKNCVIQSAPSQPHGTMSAGVYASVATGRLSEIIIENNTFVPYPKGLEHWGIYFVQGVSDFTIVGNTFSPAGEDAITIWHSQSGVIARNRGGGNGENTIDVKDSYDIVIRDNRGEDDGEYNIVVHGVDSVDGTLGITVEGNTCLRAGRAGQLKAGIAVLFARKIRIMDNTVENAHGAGIFENDSGEPSGNEIVGNLLRQNGVHQAVGAITLERPSGVQVTGNIVDRESSSGFGIRIEGVSHHVVVRGNRLMTGSTNMIQLTVPEDQELRAEAVREAHEGLTIDHNFFYLSGSASFAIGHHNISFDDWQSRFGADTNSRVLPTTEFSALYPATPVR